MKKSIWLLSLVFVVATRVLAQEIEIEAIQISAVTPDNSDPWRYSTLKALDENDLTVFAAPRSQTDTGFLFRLHFVEPVYIDEIKIKAGYFDSRYYRQNHRIKEVKIEFNIASQYTNNSLHVEENFFLEDQMREQTISLENPILTSDISLDFDGLYESSRYDDVCITEISFYHQGQKYEITPASRRDSEELYIAEGSKIYQVKRISEFTNEIINYYYIDEYNAEGISVIRGFDNDLGSIRTFIRKLQNTIEYGNIYSSGREQIFQIDTYNNENLDKLIMTTFIDRNNNRFSSNYYYIDNRLAGNDYGEFIYKDGRLMGFFRYDYFIQRDSTPSRDILSKFPSYELNYDPMGNLESRYGNDEF